MPRALIMGCGVAGAVAGLALQKAGWEPTIFEAYDQSAGLEQGVYLTLAVNGLDALRAVDAAGVVGALGFPTGTMRFANGAGNELGAMAIGPAMADGTTTRTMRRADLYRALYELATASGVTIEHGKRLVAATSDSRGVVATFADGTEATGEVLVGADGLRSATRKIIDPRAPAPRYTGMGNVGSFSHTPGVLADGGDYRMIWGRHCFFGYTVAPDGEVWWFANPPSKHELTPEQLRTAPATIKAQLADLLARDSGPASAIVASTKREILVGNQHDLPSIPTWHRDRMVLIGDAAHAVFPSTGQGVSLAARTRSYWPNASVTSPRPRAPSAGSSRYDASGWSGWRPGARRWAVPRQLVRFFACCVTSPFPGYSPKAPPLRPWTPRPGCSITTSAGIGSTSMVRSAR